MCFSSHKWSPALQFLYSQQLLSSHACQPKFKNLVFFPDLPSFLLLFSIREQVTGVKAVAGSTSHVSKNCSQQLLHACFLQLHKIQPQHAGIQVPISPATSVEMLEQPKGDLGSTSWCLGLGGNSAWLHLLNSAKKWLSSRFLFNCTELLWHTSLTEGNIRHPQRFLNTGGFFLPVKLQHLICLEMSRAILLQCEDIEAVSFYTSVLEIFQVGAMVIEYCGKGQSQYNPISGGFIISA